MRTSALRLIVSTFLLFLRCSVACFADDDVEVKVGPFSSHTTLGEARAVDGAQYTCESDKRAEYSVVVWCAVKVKTADSASQITFSPFGNLLAIERYMPIPTGMSVSTAFDQARDHYKHLGAPIELKPPQILRTENCSVSEESSTCASVQPPPSDVVYGLKWGPGDEEWRLTVDSRDSSDQKVFEHELPNRKLLRTFWENPTAVYENRERVFGEFKKLESDAGTKKLDF